VECDYWCGFHPPSSKLSGEAEGVAERSIMKRIKLFFIKRRLRQAHYKLIEMQDDFDCGSQMLDYIKPKVARQRELVDQLYERCLELEAYFKPRKEGG